MKESAYPKKRHAFLLLALFSIFTSFAQVNTQDSLALVALYNATDGDNWTNNENWLLGPVGSWYGISTDDSRVSTIQIRNNNLTGRMPSVIGQLDKLVSLELGYNNLSGSIPTEIGQLATLVILNLRGNQISGDIPSSIKQLTELSELKLEMNSISGSLIPDLFLLDKLKTLNLGGNKITGTIPAEIGQLSTLEELIFSGNDLTGNIPGEIGLLTNLQNLNLGSNKLTGEIPITIGNLVNLSTISIQENQISGIIPVQIGQLLKLESIYFDKNDLSGPIPKEIGHLSKLSRIQFKSNQFTGAIPEELYELTELENLGLGFNALSGQISSKISQLNKLTNLSLGGNQFSGEIPVEIGELSELQGLYLYHNNFSGIFPSEIWELTNLVGLFLEDNNFTGSISAKIKNLRNLTILRIGDNSFNGTFPAEIGLLSELFDLRIDGNKFEGKIPSSLFSLTKLWIADLKNNQFDEIEGTTITPSESFTTIRVENNNLTFEDIENKFALYDNTLNYSPQAKIGQPETITADEGSTYTLDVTCGGTENIYQWYFNDQALGTASSNSTFELTNLTEANEGEYHCEITNTIVPDLTIESEPITLVVQENECMRDSLALVALYHATDGDNWTNNDNWLTKNIDTWFGISTDGCNVTSIVLNNNNLTGTIPVAIGDIVNLKKIDLHENGIGGSIPIEIGQLRKLEHLNFAWNQLMGSIPNEMGVLKELVFLRLYYNELNGVIPQEICDLTNLKVLELDGNTLTGSIPTAIGNLSNLEHLSLRQNQLTGSIPAEIGSANKLRTLYLGNNNLSGVIPNELCNLINLENLQLLNNNLSGELPKDIGLLQMLNGIDLSNNSLSGSIPVSIGNLLLLGYLRVDQNNFSGFPKSNIFKNQAAPLLHAFQNQFEFDDLEPFFDLEMYEFFYSPQAKIGEPETITLNEDESYTLDVTCGGTANSYQWFFNNQPLGSPSSSSTYILNNLTTADAGEYYCQISNSIVTELVIESEPITMQVNSLCNREQDSLALVAFYNSTNGDNWTRNDNWLSGNIDTWYGITTDGCNVTSINFNYDVIINSGSIPPEIGNLPELKYLGLNLNNLTGTIPTSIGNLTKLTYLDLGQNDLSGTIPETIGQLTNIIRLSFGDNQLSGTIPVSLGSLINLKELILFDNKLQGNIPEEFVSLKSIERIALTRNMLEGEIPEWISQLQELTKLELEENNFIGDVPEAIVNMPKLEHLLLRNNKLENFIPYKDINSVSLDWIFIENNMLTFEDLEDKTDNNYSRFFYAPQNKIGQPQTISMNAGSSYTLDVECGGSANSYQWYFNDQVLGLSSSSSSYELSNLSTNDSGDYYCEITNRIVPGLSIESEPKTIQVTEVNQSPTNISLSDTNIDENLPIGSVVATISTIDPNADETFTYSLSNTNLYPDNSAFSISGDQLLSNAVFDFENQSSYNIQIQTEDSGGASFAAAFDITINDVAENNPPVDISLSNNSILENQNTGTEVGLLSTEDDDTDDLHAYSLTSGPGDTDNHFFQISGELLLSNEVFDFELQSLYSIRIESADSSGANFSKPIEIQILDEDETIAEELFVPNAFSPNNDGYNDYFEIKGLEIYPNATLSVYSRYGILVFQQGNYGNAELHGPDALWWDGLGNTSGENQGEILPEGVYFIVLKLNNTELEKKSILLKK